MLKPAPFPPYTVVLQMALFKSSQTRHVPTASHAVACNTQVVRLHDMPDGYEVSIRTPVTPPRWEDFNEVRAAACQAACLPAPAHACMRPGIQQAVTQSLVWVS